MRTILKKSYSYDSSSTTKYYKSFVLAYNCTNHLRLWPKTKNHEGIDKQHNAAVKISHGEQIQVCKTCTA